MPVLKSLAAVGIAKQTAVGSPAATPVYGFGVRGGNLFNLDLSQDPDAVTGFGSRVRASADRTGVVVGAQFSFRCYPRSVPLWLYAALGAIATTGTTPKQHVLTPDPAGALPYLTLFTRYGSEYNSIADCLVDKLTIEWSRGAVEGSVELLGVTPSFGISPWTATNDESAQPRYQTFPGSSASTYKLDTISATPVTAKVNAGSIEIANNLTAQELSAGLAPVGLVPGVQQVIASITTQPDDLLDFRKIVTGAAGGTTITGVIPTSSFEIFWNITANDDLKLASTLWQPTVAYPEVDPAGGIAEVVLAGEAYGATTAFTATAHNTTASY